MLEGRLITLHLKTILILKYILIMAEQFTAEQFRKSVEEHYALKKELNHKNKVINILIDKISEMVENHKRQLLEKDNKIDELNKLMKTY